jgi:hypothetical protein
MELPNIFHFLQYPRMESGIIEYHLTSAEDRGLYFPETGCLELPEMGFESR